MVAKIRETLPSMKVLFMSGHAGEAIKAGGKLEASDHLLEKPFYAHDLLKAVRELLRRVGRVFRYSPQMPGPEDPAYMRACRKKGRAMCCPALLSAAIDSNLERIAQTDLSLTREAAAAAQVGEHEERRRQALVAVRVDRVVEIRPVRDVEDVQENLERLLIVQVCPPAGADVGLEVVGAVGAVSAPGVFHDSASSPERCRCRCRPATGSVSSPF